MNVSYKAIELLEKKMKLEKERDEAWKQINHSITGVLCFGGVGTLMISTIPLNVYLCLIVFTIFILF
jgi:hypothetical protein